MLALPTSALRSLRSAMPGSTRLSVGSSNSVRALATAASPLTWTPAPASKPATLHLKSGHSWQGKSFGAPNPRTFGEVVFTTSITSYTESLTDPSYQGQILTFTQPLIGNYGVPNNFSGTSPIGSPKDVDVGSFLESRGVQAAGVVVSNLAERFSHFEAIESLSTWCARHGVPGISGVDTRAITTLLRDQGSTLGAISIGDGHEVTPGQEEYRDPMAENLIPLVSTKTPYTLHPVGGASAAKVHIALLDFGAKSNIIRCLIREGASVTVLPWNYDFTAVQDKFDGLFLSNGPGSPYSIPEAVETTRKTIAGWDKPIFGICMGNQIIGLAAGLKAYRMKFGNRGHNQPVVALSSTGTSVKAGRVYITSQNHGYALEYDPNESWGEWQPWFVNANDSSVEGIRANPDSGRLVWAVQFHPENAGGPDDCQGMFKDYINECIKKNQETLGGKVSPGLDASQVGEAPRGSLGAKVETAAELAV
ncbi:small subunit of carbamoyl phosphate synthase [Microstroma glucosiphilum]|uniref:Carbamoyl phosphate synthase arginine-specific small chain n=1 Tax=Pseudomicrostroma glucosiphilum TaxID=1684307 RepID=A0A316UCF3_9BASI|nr:small subunit of carbamoyl phosphate synthase [Pseudomicrostroma glucosiphilum]PWN22548.1 small subunit of carbamoyl phosphate synthase [Pseudomicrostroma glucosiphilum]